MLKDLNMAYQWYCLLNILCMFDLDRVELKKSLAKVELIMYPRF